ncbi:MAG: hypothetical protein AB7O65_13275 [Candidatus Korobacteraceae bacterium]
MDWLVHLAIYILQAHFAVGMCGSVLVLILSAISEARSAFGEDNE